MQEVRLELLIDWHRRERRKAWYHIECFSVNWVMFSGRQHTFHSILISCKWKHAVTLRKPLTWFPNSTSLTISGSGRIQICCSGGAIRAHRGWPNDACVALMLFMKVIIVPYRSNDSGQSNSSPAHSVRRSYCVRRLLCHCSSRSHGSPCSGLWFGELKCVAWFVCPCVCELHAETDWCIMGCVHVSCVCDSAEHWILFTFRELLWVNGKWWYIFDDFADTLYDFTMVLKRFLFIYNLANHFS